MGKIINMKKVMGNTTIERHINEGLQCGLSQFSDSEGNSPSYEQLLNNEKFQPVLSTVHAVMSGWALAKGVDPKSLQLTSENLLRISRGESLH